MTEEVDPTTDKWLIKKIIDHGFDSAADAIRRETEDHWI